MPTDRFGVAMLYPTRPGGEVWTLSEDPRSDARFDPHTPLFANPDGSWKVRGAHVRMHVYTSTGYRRGAIRGYQRKELARRGYMLAPNDWRDVEMTGYVRLNKAPTGNEDFAWYARGGEHTSSVRCAGSSYKAALHFDGRARWLKESWHVHYEATPLRRATSPLAGRWVGLKAVMRNASEQGQPVVRLEMWLDDDEDPRTWTRIYSLTDRGTWGGQASHCGGEDAMPLTWGGPIAAFRWDGATDVDIRWLSVREVQ